MTALLWLIVALVAGGIASITGFGIGSLLTPALETIIDIKLAVAAVAIPHLVATALRFWLLRRSVDKRVLLWFGLASAAGGLAGALLYARAGGTFLTLIFAALLVFAGVAGVTGIAGRMRLRGIPGLAAGVLSGLLGGMVGNQGGIRSAALLGFGLSRDAFVATATAIGVLVDVVRMPLYLWMEGPRLLEIWPTIAWLTAGVVIGTIFGRQALSRIPEPVFRRGVGVVVLLLGLYMFARGMAAR